MTSESSTRTIKGVYEANTGSAAWDSLQKSLRGFSFDQKPGCPVLVTTVRKSSTHLVRNFAAHFFGPAAIHWDFVGEQGLRKNFEAFQTQVGSEKWLYTGHVARSWATNALFREAKIILVVRDPYSQVISRALHFLNEDTQDPFSKWLRASNCSIEEAIFYSIFGADYQGWKHNNIAHEYSEIAAAWLDRADVVLRYEDITGNDEVAIRALSDAAEKLGWNSIERCDERIRASVDPSASASFGRRKKELAISPSQAKMIDHLIPGVREMFGYA